MRRDKPYLFHFLNGINLTISAKIGLLVICFVLSFQPVKATGVIIEIELEPVVSFDEVPVSFTVSGSLRFEADVVITESNKVYININELFNGLGIKCIPTNQGNNLIGFIEKESKTYNIDFNAKQISIGEKVIHAPNGFIKESGATYVESTIITQAFGLNIIFNFRSLSIKLEPNFELPIVKQMRLEQMRQNVSKLQRRDVVADTIVGRNYHFFRFGMIDWSLASYQRQGEEINNRVVLGVGTELLYGQANVSVYYDDKYQFDNRQLYYNWRWVDNEKNIIKQAQLGKVYNQSISFLEAPVVGGSISNTPTTVRKASGYRTISDYTEPNWTVELYINDVLVDYTVADASGFFVFNVPIVYGYTTLKLKFYGPMGEERTEERIMNVPFTFTPQNTLEYNVMGGFLQDDENSQFGRGVVNYGINSFITVGGGLEYLSSIPEYPFIPFATLAFQPFSKMVLNFEYAHNVAMKGLLNYYFGRNAFLEIDYADFVDGQMATRFNANEELKVRLSMPFKVKKVSGYTKLNFNHYAYDAFNFNQIETVLSGYYKNYSANLSTLANWVNENEPYVTSNLSLSYRMKNGLIFRPSAEYNISNNELMRCKVEIERRVAKAYYSVSYERNMAYKTDNVFFSFRYDLPFARTGISASYNNNMYSFAENAQGSVAFGENTVKEGYNSSLGKGGILFYPFLDLNQNGVFDKGEQMVLLSNVRVTGGQVEISEKDSIVRVSDLNAFANYVVEFNDNNLDNITWRFKHKTYQVLVDPNQYKRVDIPVIVVGEYTGKAYLKQGNSLNGIGRILVNFYKKGSKTVYAKTLTESDGYIYCLEFEPGEYVALIDSAQIGNLNYSVEPKQVDFTINPSIDGDMVIGADFVLNDNSYVELPKIELAEQVVAEKEESIFNEVEKANDEVFIIDLEIYAVEKPIEIPKDKHSMDFSDENVEFWGEICNEPRKYYVQCGAFRKKSNATNLALFISQKIDKPVGISFIDGYYKVQVGCVDTRKEAEEIRIWMEEIVVNTDMFFKARRGKDIIYTPAP